jgi:hypothetical protein
VSRLLRASLARMRTLAEPAGSGTD